MTPVFSGIVENGNLKLDPVDRSKMLEHFKSLHGPVTLTIEKKKKKSSNQQLRYYFGVIVKMLSEYTGYTKDQMHQALKQMFLHEPDSLFSITKSYKKLTPAEAEEYHENIRRFSAEKFQIYIPDPNEVNP